VLGPVGAVFGACGDASQDQERVHPGCVCAGNIGFQVIARVEALGW